MNGNILLGLALGGLIILYVLSYFGTRAYLRENFADAASVKAPAASAKEEKKPAAAKELDMDVSSTTSIELPYEQRPIDSVDDYEYNLVFQNESDRPLTMAMRNKLMSQYPLDWSGYPPSSAQFQAGLRETFENATPSVPDDAKPYQNISGNLMSPPDTGATEAEERKILSTYKPTFPPDPTAYDPEDVNDLVKKIYAVKGLVPELKKRENTNVYEVVGTRPIKEEVKWEDEPAAVGADAQAPIAAAGEGVVQSVSAAQDQFFEEKRGSARMNKWDYTAWTPGLERSFAPTNPLQNWY